MMRGASVATPLRGIFESNRNLRLDARAQETS